MNEEYAGEKCEFPGNSQQHRTLDIFFEDETREFVVILLDATSSIVLYTCVNAMALCLGEGRSLLVPGIKK